MDEMEKKQWKGQTLFSPDGPRGYGKEPQHQWPLRKDGHNHIRMVVKWKSDRERGGKSGPSINFGKKRPGAGFNLV